MSPLLTQGNWLLSQGCATEWRMLKKHYQPLPNKHRGRNNSAPPLSVVSTKRSPCRANPPQTGEHCSIIQSPHTIWHFPLGNRLCSIKTYHSFSLLKDLGFLNSMALPGQQIKPSAQGAACKRRSSRENAKSPKNREEGWNILDSTALLPEPPWMCQIHGLWIYQELILFLSLPSIRIIPRVHPLLRPVVTTA